MQCDAQMFLRLAESAGALAVLDIEATGLRGDYNSVLVVSIKPVGRKVFSLTCRKPGDDKALVIAAKAALDDFAAWITYYGRGFDIPMLNTRLLQHGAMPLAKRHHVDMYYHLRAHLLTARRSQGHLLSWLDTPEKKMGVSAEAWNAVLRDPTTHMPTMVKRCESDTKGLEGLYMRTKHVIAEVTR